MHNQESLSMLLRLLGTGYTNCRVQFQFTVDPEFYFHSLSFLVTELILLGEKEVHIFAGASSQMCCVAKIHLYFRR